MPEFAPVFSEEDIVNLPKYEFYIKLMIDGISSDPFSARGLPPLAEEEESGNIDKVIAISRERYAKKREVVEEKIMRWIEKEGDDSKNDKEEKGGQDRKYLKQGKPVKSTAAVERKDIYKFKAVCSRCGQTTETSFTPDGIRPVYCKECLSKTRQEKREDIENRKRAKGEELKRLEESEKQEAISLKQAASMRPVTFKNTLRGRGRKDLEPLKSNRFDKNKTTNPNRKPNPNPVSNQPNSSKAQGELIPGEEVVID